MIRTLLALTACAALALAAEPVNRFPAGDLSATPVKTQPAGWTFPWGFGVGTAQEDISASQTALRFDGTGSDARNAWSELALDPAWKTVTVTVDWRLMGFVKGKEGWHTARVLTRFHGADGQPVGDYPPAPELAADSDWTTTNALLPIPAGATALRLEPGMYHCGGTLWVRRIVVASMP
jgi:hypothetical protein